MVVQNGHYLRMSFFCDQYFAKILIKNVKF